LEGKSPWEGIYYKKLARKGINMSYLSRQQITDLKMPELKLVECRLRQVVESHGHALGATARYILGLGGKRIRPLLILLTSAIYGAPLRARLDLAASAELIHTASLIHDDIIDASNLRRGKATANARWGNNHSVLAGDYLFSRAFTLLSQLREGSVLKIMTEAISAMCQGELLQLKGHFQADLNPEVYLSTIAGKTGSLIAACCEAGASISPMPQGEIETLRDYGMKIGIAYQIVDDIGDYCLQDNQSGKPPGLDLANGIITLPLIYLLQDNKYGGPIREALINDSLSRANLIDVLQESGAVTKATVTALAYVDGAARRLEELKPCPETQQLMVLAGHFRQQCLRFS
jgi:heptaprenyl diphosphate synthase